MREVLAELVEDWRAGRVVGLATVVRTMKSAPRAAGAVMVRRADGAVVGSVSGGCVEGAIYELAGDVVDTGVPALRRYGVSDDQAFEAGLTCGGILDVFVEPVDRLRYPQLEGVAADIEAGRPVATVTVIRHPDPQRVGARLVVRPDSAEGTLTGTENETDADQRVADDARGLLASGLSTTLEYGPNWERQGDGIEVYVGSHAPKPRMLVFGAIDFAAAAARQGKLLGFHVTVCDARPVFATRARFPDTDADELVVEWPSRYLAREIDQGRVDDRTVVCVLTHDPKFDVPILMEAFRMPAGCFLGAMGSRRTHDDRLRRLREAGATETDLARLHSPIGLALGARTPAETAVSISAEIIATQWDGAAVSLGATSGPIHARSGGGHAGTGAAGVRAGDERR